MASVGDQVWNFVKSVVGLGGDSGEEAREGMSMQEEYDMYYTAMMNGEFQEDPEWQGDGGQSPDPRQCWDKVARNGRKSRSGSRVRPWH